MCIDSQTLAVIDITQTVEEKCFIADHAERIVSIMSLFRVEVLLMQILSKLLCEDCGSNCELYTVVLPVGNVYYIETNDSHTLCKSCIDKRESEEEL